MSTAALGRSRSSVGGDGRARAGADIEGRRAWASAAELESACLQEWYAPRTVAQSDAVHEPVTRLSLAFILDGSGSVLKKQDS